MEIKQALLTEENTTANLKINYLEIAGILLGWMVL